jgi:hypothetical protein
MTDDDPGRHAAEVLDAILPKETAAVQDYALAH